MSDYKLAVEKIDTFQKTIVEIESSKEDIALVEKYLEDGKSILVCLSPLMDKIKNRSKEIDPVTGNPRYGVKMQTKVQVTFEEYQVALEKFNLLYTSLQEKIQLNHQKLRQLEMDHQHEMEQQNKLKLLKEENERILFEKKEEEQCAKELVNRMIQQEEEKKIALLAEKKREERKKLREMEQQVLLLEEQKEMEKQLEEERMDAKITVGIQGLDDALDILSKNCSPQAFENAKATLLVFISNICNKVEDPTFRNIKAMNPHYHSAIGQYLGGNQCLKAMGFTVAQIDQEKVFTLIEPKVEDDFDKWCEWFEQIKTIRDHLASM